MLIWWFPQCMKNHEYICTMHGNLKIYQNSTLHIYRHQNGEIAKLSLIQVYDTIILQIISYTTNQILYSKYNWFD